MTTNDVVKAFFVAEWEHVASSPDMRRAIHGWRTSSGGLIDVGTGEELLAVVKHRSDTVRSRAVSAWLVEVDEPLARRVMVQATHPFVLAEISRSHLRGAKLADWSQSCTAAVVLAVGSLSGCAVRWPMWAIRRAFTHELKLLAAEYEPGGVEPCYERLPASETPDHATTLGKVLRGAADAERISVRDAQIVWLTATGFVTRAEAAARLGVQPSSLRKHQTRTVRRVAAHVTG